MRKSLIATIAVTTIAVSGCATMSEEECLTADWRAVGVQDGSAGRTTNWFSRRSEDCARHGVTPDFTSWEIGYRSGLMSYCTPYNGVQSGLRGNDYQGVCPANLEAEFYPAYQLGRRYHDARARLDAAHAELDDLDRQIESLRNDIRYERGRLETDSELSEEDRRSIRDRIRRLRDDRRDARMRRDDIEASLYELERDEQRAGSEVDAYFPGVRY